MQRKLVLLLPTELEGSITRAVQHGGQWEVKVIKTGADRQQSLTDVDRLTEQLQGADSCFISTSTDFNNDRNVEVQEGMCIGQACKKAGVKHVVLAAHLHCEKTIGIPAKHYDAKAEIYTYMRQTLGLPVTMLNIPPFYEMFFDFLCPAPQPENFFELVFPSVGPASIDFIALDDVGCCLIPILDNPEVFSCKTIALSGDKLTGKIVTKILCEETNLRLSQKQVTVQQVRERNYTGAIDIANMFEFLGRGDLKASTNGTQELYGGLQDFRFWVQQNLDKLMNCILNNRSQLAKITVVI